MWWIFFDVKMTKPPTYQHFSFFIFVSVCLDIPYWSNISPYAWYPAADFDFFKSELLPQWFHSQDLNSLSRDIRHSTTLQHACFLVLCGKGAYMKDLVTHWTYRETSVVQLPDVHLCNFSCCTTNVLARLHLLRSSRALLMRQTYLHQPCRLKVWHPYFQFRDHAHKRKWLRHVCCNMRSSSFMKYTKALAELLFKFSIAQADTE